MMDVDMSFSPPPKQDPSPSHYTTYQSPPNSYTATRLIDLLRIRVWSHQKDASLVSKDGLPLSGGPIRDAPPMP